MSNVRNGSKTEISERFERGLFGNRNPVFVWLDCRVPRIRSGVIAMTPLISSLRAKRGNPESLFGWIVSSLRSSQ